MTNHVLEDHERLDNMVEVGSSSLNHGPEVLERLVRLLLDATGHNLHGLWVKGNLARRVDHAVHDNGLRCGELCWR